MFPNLLAEMARNDITQEDIMRVTGRCRSNISEKINGKRDWYLSEMKKIKTELFTDLTLDYLFDKKEQ